MEDISTLIRDVSTQFQRSGPDLQDIQKTMEDITETEKMRNEMLQDARSVLQSLSRSVQRSRSMGNRSTVDPESLNHDEYMINMDQQKFTLAQSIQDLDQSIASLEAEAQQLRMDVLELDSSHVSRGDHTPDSRRLRSRTGADIEDDDEDNMLDDPVHAMTVLKLQLYRGLGIEMIESDRGEYTKARIRSHNSNEVHLVKFDDQLSPYYQTNLIWDFAS
ncbi:hypothetical protein BGZ94_009312 [Podila epigama]|nr:hypothetical protein BGZ94_009312 [Podila epigama]